MSRGAGALQRRTTTYLISLTLVKLESVPPPPPSPSAAAAGAPGARSSEPRDPGSPRGAEEPGKKRHERLFHRQDALWISTSSAGAGGAEPPTLSPAPASPARPVSPAPGRRLSLWAAPPGPPLSGGLSPDSKPGGAPSSSRRPLLSSPSWGGPEPEGRTGGGVPGSSSPHPGTGSRRLKVAPPPPAPKPFKTVTTSGAKASGGKGAGSRLSWPESEGKPRVKGSKSSAGTGASATATGGGGGAAVTTSGGVGAGAGARGKLSPRKGKSKTLDNSDLHPGPTAGSPPLTVPATPVPATSVTTTSTQPLGPAPPITLEPPAPGLKRGREGGRASTRDRKMLKFISGIFTKSTGGPPGPGPLPGPPGLSSSSGSRELLGAELRASPSELGGSGPETPGGLFGVGGTLCKNEGSFSLEWMEELGSILDQGRGQRLGRGPKAMRRDRSVLGASWRTVALVDAYCRKASHRSLRPQSQPWLESRSQAIGTLPCVEGHWRCREGGSLSFP